MKFLYLLLTVFVALGLLGCGEESTGSTKTNTSKKKSSAKSSSSVVEEEEESTEDDELSEEETEDPEEEYSEAESESSSSAEQELSSEKVPSSSEAETPSSANPVSSSVLKSSSSYVKGANIPDGSRVKINGTQMTRQYLKGGKWTNPETLRIKAVCYSPTAVGERGDAGGYPRYYVKYGFEDIKHLKALKVNAIRTYDIFVMDDRGLLLLDSLYANGIGVIMQVASYYRSFDNGSITKSVKFFKDHPAILFWQVGNEYNYNNLYSNSLTHAQATEKINKGIAEIKAVDTNHPVAVGIGDIHAASIQQTNGDLYSANIYRNEKLINAFSEFKNLSNKPLFIGEYGSDSWNNKAAAEDQFAQAYSDSLQTVQILSNLSADNAANVVVGGAPYNFTDEWWKSRIAGSTNETHDAGGFDNGGVHPDQYANEEWWGLMTVDRQPKRAFSVIATLYGR